MNTVVYYPHIWPRPEWLRLSALCWDRVYTLNVDRSSGRRAPPPYVEELASALPDHLDTSSLFAGSLLDKEIEERFKRWVVAHEDSLRSHVSDEHQELFGVYDKKFQMPFRTEESLRDWLVGRGLARVVEPGPEEYGLDDGYMSEVGASMFVADTIVYLPKNIALHYLSLIASKAASETNRDLATDGAVFTDAVFHDARVVRANVAAAVLEAYLPEDFDEIELARIADLRSELATRRLRYQAAVQELVSEFEVVSSEGELKTIERQIIDIATERINQTRDAYRRANLSTALQSFSITLTPPAVVSSIASAIGIGLFAPAGIALALSLFGAGVLIDRREAKEKRLENPWSYVLDVAAATKNPNRS